MRIYNKQLISIGAAAILAFCTITPSIAAQTSNEAKITEEYRLINKYFQLEDQKEKIEQGLKETKKEIKKKKVPIDYFESYGKELTLDDYSRIINIAKENNLKGKVFKKFVNLERVLEYETFVDEVAEYYAIDKQDMIKLWNQESNFNIKGKGGHGERGLAQFKESIAKLRLDSIVNPKYKRFYFDWEKFYPEFDIKNYNFKQLSEDYKLNIIMTAAQVKSTSLIFKDYLEKTNMTLDQLLKIVRTKGKHTKLEILKAAQKNPKRFNLNKDTTKAIKKYNLTKKRIKEINKIYSENPAMLKTALKKYTVHNGGGGAVKNITKDSVIGELLIYHLALYVKNLQGVYKLMNYHYGSLENLVKSNEYMIKKLTIGQTFDFWGNEVKKVDLQKLRNYFQHDLIIDVNPEFFERKQIRIINDYIINEDLSLQHLDKDTIKLFSITGNIDRMYEKLIMFKQLEEAQIALNESWAKNDKKNMKLRGKKVVKLESDMNKRFDMQRKHTGIRGIQIDIAKLEKEIKNAGFEPDLGKYKQMKDNVIISKEKDRNNTLDLTHGESSIKNEEYRIIDF